LQENRNRTNARQTIKPSHVKQASRHNQSNKYTQNAFNEVHEIEYKKYSTRMILVREHLVENTRTPRSIDVPDFGWRRSGERNKSDQLCFEAGRSRRRLDHQDVLSFVPRRPFLARDWKVVLHPPPLPRRWDLKPRVTPSALIPDCLLDIHKTSRANGTSIRSTVRLNPGIEVVWN
jgi:hypothetical protein